MNDDDATSRLELSDPPTVTRIIRPLGPRVVVKLIEAEERSPGGLFCLRSSHPE